MPGRQLSGIRRDGIGDTFTPEEIERALRMPLPGYGAQVRMSPSHRELVPPAGKGTPYMGAVLVLLYPGNEQRDLFLPLTVRTENVKVHKGQISFPGGGSEPEDASLVHTALREACEELGVCSEDVRIMGALTPIYIEPSNFHVHPFVAYLPYRPSFVLQIVEVMEVLEVPVSHFFDQKNAGVEDWLIGGVMRRIPYFDVRGYKVWGATAIILSEFVAILEGLGKEPDPAV
ncbi:MAG: CoA pyrophosphatase [Syntrophorhabdaceae bacterium]|nr:CoA pyrophosphatase [Syntrophorhabdaceae bacterium]